MNSNYHLSASSIAALKACPTRFRLAYREGLRLIEDTESQRMGTNWGALHECYGNALAGDWKKLSDRSIAGCRGSVHAGTYHTPEDALERVVELLNERYAGTPVSKTPEEWALERQILLTSFIGYLWYWQNDPVEVLASEMAFKLPLRNPQVGLNMPLSQVVRVGKIDHIVRWHGAVCAMERKSTSKAIDPDSDYWEKSRKDTQVSMYALAFRDMLLQKQAPEWLSVEMMGSRMGNTLYDVWHKPTIKPAMLTQAATKAVLHDQQYYDTEFEIKEVGAVQQDSYGVTVNGVSTEVEIGKSGAPAIRETVEMFGARLLNDIQKRPEFYFQRREIGRTDAEIQKFEKDLYAIYQTMQAIEKANGWYENESQCRATFPCPFIPVCYGPGSDAVCSSGATPTGFRRILVTPTVNGQPIEE